MTRTNNQLINLINEFNTQLSGTSRPFDKQMLDLINRSSFLSNSRNNFPLSDLYIVYEDEKKEKIKNLDLKFYLAGYKKEDIEISFNDKTQELFVSGKISPENKNFPESERTERYTHNVSKKSFKQKYVLNNYDIGEVDMNDGVLSIILNPTKEKHLRKIDF